MQKIGCSLCKSENPLYEKIPSEKNLLLLKSRMVAQFKWFNSEPGFGQFTHFFLRKSNLCSVSTFNVR